MHEIRNLKDVCRYMLYKFIVFKYFVIVCQPVSTFPSENELILILVNQFF